MENKRSGLARKLGESVKLVLWSVALAVVMKATVVSAYYVPSGSMEPTLITGDRFLAFPSAYSLKLPLVDEPLFSFDGPKRGDVITFKNPVEKDGEDWVKRVIGLPGETVEVRGKAIYINGKALQDPWGSYVGGPGEQNLWFGPVRVPKESYFVMGDNRDNSFDSRFWGGKKGGFVPKGHIRSKALIIYFSHHLNQLARLIQ